MTTEIDHTTSTDDSNRHSPFTKIFSFIFLVAFPSLHEARASHIITILIPGSTSSLPLASSSTSIGNAWSNYLSARVAEWKVVFTLACVLIGLSLTVYQIPQAISDPLTYTFTSIAQYRAFVGLVYATVLRVYFDNEYTRTAKFAIIWWKIATETKDNIWNTWVMLSLPAASTFWALLFYFFAIISFVFRSTTPTLGGQPMPFGLNITLQTITTTSILLDLVCLACTWVTLKKYRETYYTTHEEV